MTRGVWLAIEAATPVGSVAVSRDGVLLSEVVLGVQSRHSEALLPAADYALREAGATMAELAAVVVGGGPGSFTGVRVAAAAAKGLARALDVPLHAWSSLAALAAGAGFGEAPTCALFDARREEVYAACYRFPNGATCETLLEPVACSLADAIEQALPHGARFVGDGARRHAAAIEAAGGTVVHALHVVPRAGALLWLASLEAAGRAGSAGGRVEDVGTWEPAYLRESAAVKGLST
jgi:tRNA threonylcarbamoyladenosine biosynthesis protein TsaB